MRELTYEELVENIERLIDSGMGDTGRLYHILLSVKKHKRLFQSDAVYLESRLSMPIIVQRKNPPPKEDLLTSIQKLIARGHGDASRLDHIRLCLEKEKPLYKSDQIYLENKLGRHIDVATVPQEHLRKLEYRLQNTNQYIDTLEKQLTESQQQKLSLLTTAPLPASESISQEIPTPQVDTKYDNVTSKVSDEIRENILKDKQSRNEIDSQRSVLSDMISNRQENEKQIALEKLQIQSAIDAEQKRVSEQTEISKQIALQKSELGVVQKQREQILKEIQTEKHKVTKDFDSKSKALADAKLEREDLHAKALQQQSKLATMVHEQQSKLSEQSNLVKSIREKQLVFDDLQSDYDGLKKQVSEEKKKLTKQENLRKSILAQQKDLIKMKEKRLKIITQIKAQQDKKTAQSAPDSSVKKQTARRLKKSKT